MTRLFIPIGAVVMSLFCFGMAHDHPQGQKNRLNTLRKNITDFSKEHGREIQKVAKTVSSAAQKSSIIDDEKIMEKTNESDVNNIPVNDLVSEGEKEFKRLCSGEVLITADIQKKLKCRYVDHGIPFLRMAPFKEEEAALDPRIVLYHNVIYEEEIEALKTLSRPQLKRAKTLNTISGVQRISEDRIAEIAWIVENENMHVKLLSRRVEHMTGLSADTAEVLQIAYYDIGGFYKVHKDFFNDGSFYSKNFENRIATVLFYMNDVTEGGTTVFPSSNTILRPQKGSAAFWYNLKRNGKGDYLTYHGACPVLSGTKWVATLWLNEKGQEFRRPCTLLQSE